MMASPPNASPYPQLTASMLKGIIQELNGIENEPETVEVEPGWQSFAKLPRDGY